jgi:ubiquinone/menaquinone biosynthesis C-methylase UbiE
MENTQTRSQQEYQPFPNVERRNVTQELIEVPAMIKLLGLPKYGRILEVGCGRGIALPTIHRLCQPSRLVGLDVDAELTGIAQARITARKFPCEIVTADLRAMPFPDASFDMVIDFGTCYHIARADHALHEIARVLAPNGLFVHETVISQFLSHPFLSWGKRIPWSTTTGLQPFKTAGLWAVRRKT